MQLADIHTNTSSLPVISVKSSWFVMCTRSHYEKIVEQELTFKGITNFLPLQKKLRQWSDRKKWIEEPLFRGYIFVKIKPKEFYYVITTTGVSRCITCAGKPVEVREKEIELIKKAVSGKNEIEVTQKRFAIGERVFINKGTFKGFHGVLIEYKSKYRVAVWINSLSQSLLINIPLNYLERICI